MVRIHEVPWDKADVEGMTKLWREAQAYYDKAMEFAAWLENEKDGPARFKQTVDFLISHLKEEDYNEPNKVARIACSRGLLRAPQPRNT